MDYNTKFINNINVYINYYTSPVYDGNDDTEVCFDDGVLNERLTIAPGIVADYNYNSYAVLDRNLKEGKSYKDGVNINVNERSLSFTDINKLSAGNYPLLGMYEPETYYVSEVKNNSYIFDTFKLLYKESILKDLKKRIYFNKITNKESLEKTWILTNNDLSKRYLGCLLLGVYGTTDSAEWINPNKVNGLKTNAHSIIIKFWNRWIALTDGMSVSEADKFYRDNSIYTFELFLLNEIYATNPIVEIDAVERRVLDVSLKLNTDNLKTENGKMILEVDSKKYFLRSFASVVNSNNEKIDNLAFIDFGLYKERSGNVYVYSDKKSNACKISGVGVISSSTQSMLTPDNHIVKTIVNDVFRDLRYHYDNFYQVAVIADKIKSDVITIYNVSDHTLLTYRIAHYDGRITSSFYLLSSVKTIGNFDSDEIAKALEASINDKQYITPSEYYGNALSYGEFTTGNSGYEKVSNDDADDISSWFWSDTLKNWCLFRQYIIKNTFKLYTWNGINGWDDFEDVIAHPNNYLYNIKHLRFGINFSTVYKYNNIPINYKVIILKYDSNFSQYVSDSFQTIKIGKMWSNNVSGLNRFPFTIGIPPIMRLASGELGLLYSLTISGATEDHPLIYPENIKFLNVMCRQYFGAGDEKTIVDDWKRVEKQSAAKDEPSAITSMNESTLVDADEINTVKDKAANVSMIFDPFKQYIETDNIDTDAYTERWN